MSVPGATPRRADGAAPSRLRLAVPALPGAPARGRTRDAPNRRQVRAPRATAAALMVAAALLTACSGIVDRFSGREEACAILAIGMPATAVVVELFETGTTINDNPVVGFRLEVRPADGAPFRAETRALVSRLDIPQVQPGRILPVKFDPQNPQRVALDLWECPSASPAR